ncbi:MAG: hypothetical protein H0Z24_05435 [Thermosipho sp. (in: Bacteria)]|nr:hypothetical protein [Thermosipho sp. (in: thermotogales)]
MSIIQLINEYNELKEKEQLIKKRKKEIADKIKEYAVQNGVKDDNGSYYKEEDKFIIGSQARKTVKLNQEKAKEFFLEKGLYKEVVVVKEEIDEDKVEKLLEEGKISYDELENLVTVKTTYAVFIKEREEEEMPEVEVSTREKENSTKKLRLRKFI